MPKKVDPALKDRALRMVAEHRSDYPSVTAVAKADRASEDRMSGVGRRVSGVGSPRGCTEPEPRHRHRVHGGGVGAIGWATPCPSHAGAVEEGAAHPRSAMALGVVSMNGAPSGHSIKSLNAFRLGIRRFRT